MKIMKKRFRMIVACVATFAAVIGCTKDNGEEVRGQEFDLGDGSSAFVLDENITLTYPNIYHLQGFVYVPDGITLTIEPGVIIKGDKETKGTLIIERGGKIMAKGTPQLPIVFTSAMAAGSRKPGDWGGIIILGKAENNSGDMTIEGGVRSKHGGSDNNDNSGVLSYVRCEFAGVEYTENNEINGITFGSVGRGTIVNHVQVSYSGDDSFEWFGGAVNATHLVSLGCWDDDFDTDNGYSGKVQFGVVLRDPLTADKSSSNGFESDNWSSGTPIDGKPTTKPIFANISVFGPVTDPANYVDKGSTNGSSVAVFQAAAQIRRSSQMNLFNSLLAGFPIGLIIENDKSGSNTQDMATAGNLNVNNCVIAGMINNFQDKATNTAPVYSPTNGDAFVKAYFTEASRGNRVLTSVADLGLKGNPFTLKSPIMFPTLTSPLATGAAWSHANVSSGFVQTSYVGAFSAEENEMNNWMNGWCNFDPQNTVY